MSEIAGHNLASSEKIQSLIHELASEVEKVNSSINGVRGANDSHKAAATEIIDKLGENRGRPLYLPFVGSGSGNGSFVELEDGSVKLDLINGIGINILGHSHPVAIKAALWGAVQDVVVQGNLEPNKELYRLGDKLLQIAKRNSRLEHCWITTSGSMANENALKMCRQKTNAARMIISMKAAFAGRSTLMAQVTDDPGKREGQPEYDEVRYISFFDKNNPNSTMDSLKELKEIINEHRGNICAFMFEPMQGEGGYNVAPKEFFVPLLEECKKEGIPIWADEIQTFCRTGEFFAFDTLGIAEYIDICTVAKTIQNGATLMSKDLNPKPGLIAGTFAGSSAALSAGYEILNYLDENGYMGADGKVNQVHNKFVSMLNELNETTCKGLLQDAGGLGLMCAVQPLDGSKDKMLAFLRKLYDNGLFAFGCGRGPFKIRFLLPATLSDDEITVAKSIIEKSILEMA